MKPLKLSFVLILIGSALLLSAANENTKPSEAPVPGESTKGHSQGPDQSDADPQKDKNQPIAKGDQAKPRQIAEKNKKETASIRVSPIDVNPLDVNPLDVKKDWVDYFFVVFSGLLVIVGGFQLRLLYWQFVADHRPRLKIRNVQIVSGITKIDPLYENGVEVSLVAVNWGGSPTKIVRGNITTLIDKTDSPEFMKKSLTEKDTQIPLYVKRLKPSAEYVVTTRHPPKDSKVLFIFKRDAFEKKIPPEAFYVFGYLVYRDRLRRHYKTHFCRRFDVVSERFVIVDHPDYEYAD